MSSVSRDTLSTNETHEKEDFDDWYMIIHLVYSAENMYFASHIPPRGFKA